MAKLAISRGAWRVLAGSIWRRVARSGCSGRFGWLDLAVLVAPGRSGWLDLAALGASGRRFCCAGAVFSLISLRRGSVSSRSPWMLRFGDPVRFWDPWLPRFGALKEFLGRLWGVLGRPCGALRCSWAFLRRPWYALESLLALLGCSWALLKALGSSWPCLGVFLAGSIRCKRTP